MQQFFASYSSLDNPLSSDDKVGQLGRVVKYLRDRVRAKLGRNTAEEVGFFAQSTIKSGEDWKNLLGNALCKSRVLVCLCSPTFFNSEWCASEFAVFRTRLEKAGDALATERVVLPVVWEPPRASRPVPAAVSRYQVKDDRYPERYWKVGLHTLSRLKSQQDDYVETIEQLAESICVALEGKPLPELTELPLFEKLPRSFDNPGPYSVAVGVLHNSGTQWEPETGQPSLAALVETVCTSLQLPWREIPIDLDLKGELEQAKQRRDIVVLITDDTSTQLPRWSQLITVVDSLSLDQCAVLYGYTSSVSTPGVDRSEAEQKLRTLLPETFTGTSFHGWYGAESADALKKKLEETIVRVRLTIINSDPAAKVENVGLQKSAGVEGITLGTAPIVNGPGGETR